MSCTQLRGSILNQVSEHSNNSVRLENCFDEPLMEINYPLNQEDAILNPELTPDAVPELSINEPYFIIHSTRRVLMFCK